MDFLFGLLELQSGRFELRLVIDCHLFEFLQIILKQQQQKIEENIVACNPYSRIYWEYWVI